MAKALKSIISDYFSHQKQLDWKVKLLQDWPLIIGNLAAHVNIYKIYQNSITLQVKNASWMQELYCLSHIILEKINVYLGSKKLQTIHFRLATLENKRIISHNVQETNYVKPTLTLSTRHKKALSKIQDEELSKALEGFLARCLYK